MNHLIQRFGRPALMAMAWLFGALVAWPQVGEAAAVRLMLSSRADVSSAGQDVYVVSYGSIDELLASPPTGSATQAFSGVNISSSYIASGLAYDGQYRLMLSRRDDSGTAGADVFVVTYDSFDDLIASPPTGSATQAFSGVNISSSYIASGLTYDGKYRLMLSRRDDSGAAGADVFVVTYDTFDDLIASPPTGSATQAFSGVNISSQYIASGLAYEFDVGPGPGTVAEPPSAALLMAALALLAGASSRARRPTRVLTRT